MKKQPLKIKLFEINRRRRYLFMRRSRPNTWYIFLYYFLYNSVASEKQPLLKSKTTFIENKNNFYWKFHRSQACRRRLFSGLPGAAFLANWKPGGGVLPAFCPGKQNRRGGIVRPFKLAFSRPRTPQERRKLPCMYFSTWSGWKSIRFRAATPQGCAGVFTWLSLFVGNCRKLSENNSWHYRRLVPGKSFSKSARAFSRVFSTFVSMSFSSFFSASLCAWASSLARRFS